jgi:glycerol-3-phosphate acyltransferase PlsY
MVVFIVMVLWTRRISIGSITAAATFPLAVWLILHPPVVVTAAAIVAGAVIIYRHSNNIRRIRAGTEDEFTFGAHGS